MPGTAGRASHRDPRMGATQMLPWARIWRILDPCWPWWIQGPGCHKTWWVPGPWRPRVRHASFGVWCIPDPRVKWIPEGQSRPTPWPNRPLMGSDTKARMGGDLVDSRPENLVDSRYVAAKATRKLENLTLVDSRSVAAKGASRKLGGLVHSRPAGQVDSKEQSRPRPWPNRPLMGSDTKLVWAGIWWIPDPKTWWIPGTLRPRQHANWRT